MIKETRKKINYYFYAKKGFMNWFPIGISQVFFFRQIYLECHHVKFRESIGKCEERNDVFENMKDCTLVVNDVACNFFGVFQIFFFLIKYLLLAITQCPINISLLLCKIRNDTPHFEFICFILSQDLALRFLRSILIFRLILFCQQCFISYFYVFLFFRNHI